MIYDNYSDADLCDGSPIDVDIFDEGKLAKKWKERIFLFKWKDVWFIRVPYVSNRAASFPPDSHCRYCAFRGCRKFRDVYMERGDIPPCRVRMGNGLYHYYRFLATEFSDKQVCDIMEALFTEYDVYQKPQKDKPKQKKGGEKK